MVLIARNTREVLENIEDSLQESNIPTPSVMKYDQGPRGAPRLFIDLEELSQLAYERYKDEDIAQLSGTTRRTIVRRRKEAGIPSVGYTE